MIWKSCRLFPRETRNENNCQLSLATKYGKERAKGAISSQAFSKCFLGIGRSSTREHDLKKSATRAHQSRLTSRKKDFHGSVKFFTTECQKGQFLLFSVLFLFMLCITKLPSGRRKISQQTTFSDTNCVTCLFTLQIIHTTRS